MVLSRRWHTVFLFYLLAVCYPDGTPCAVKVACTVWGGGKSGDSSKGYLSPLLYTDFRIQKHMVLELQEGRWFPEAPDSLEADAVSELLESNDLFRSAFIAVLANIRNITEDIYIEHRLKQRYKGLFTQGLDAAANSLRPILESKLHSENIDSLAHFINCFLYCLRFGPSFSIVPEVGSVPVSPSIHSALHSSLHLAEQLVEERNPHSRCLLLNELMIIILPLIRDECEKSNASSSVAELSIGPGRIIPLRDSSPNEKKAISSSLPSLSLDTALDFCLREKAESDADNLHSANLSEEAKTIMSALRAKALKGLSEKRKGSSLARLYEFRLNKCCDPSSVNIHRFGSPSAEEIMQYSSIESECSKVIRRTINLLREALSDRRPEGKLSGLPLGRRLDTSTLFRQDGKIFCSHRFPDGAPNISICVLIDESGSSATRL